MERDPDFARSALDDDPAQVWADVLTATEGAATLERQADVMAALRRAKDRSALFIALRDLGGFWSLDEVIRAVSAFADASIDTATRWLLASHAEKGLDGDGFFILGLGKLGGRELNYSSDVDIIPFFDHEGHPPDSYAARKKGFNRLIRDFVKLLSEQTADGYVHRVDLRLRPDPASTAPCMSVDAAERYYESFGKNWERAAFIKARVIAGDGEAGARFLDGMTPFVWRRYLDFAALEDVRDMKRLIHKHKGHGRIAVAGHDLKLGRGGIREIEFFAQTQQLIAGGREPALRLTRTVDTLDALLTHGWIGVEARDELVESYGVLRTLEHRLQMVADAQTHRMPSDAEELARIAAFCGHADFASLSNDLHPHLTRVSSRFDRLFENDAKNDAQPVVSLAEYRFTDVDAAQAILDRWADGSIGATKSDRARQKLNRLLPVLLGSIGEAGDPDRALVEFDRFISSLPSGVQIFSLFEANPKLLEMLTGICAAAPRLASHLGRNSGVIDALLARDFFEPTPDADALLAEYESIAPEVDDFEGNLDACRRWAKERHFRIGAALLRGIDTPVEAGRAYADLADACLRAMVAPATAEVARRHGPPPGEGACVVAMGRLGSHEMTAASDLDLIVIYDDADAMSDGPKPLAGTQYYARWTQRLVNALTAPTAEGAVYEVDMRLRPSGQSGPLATRLTAFDRYQAEQAWTWEHMALTRARVVAGPAPLRLRVEAVIDDVLVTPRERDVVLRDALEMRHRLASADEASAADRWTLKLTRGGLVDADFIVQALRLCGDDAVPEGVADARALQAALLHFIRLSHDGKFDPETAPAALKSVMAQAVGADDFAAVEDRLKSAQCLIRDAFAATFGEL
jgi:glutamate-ammonia-ligase adenylyltransferase